MAGKRPFVPVRTADPVLTEVQRNLVDTLAQLEELRRGMLAFAPKVVAGDYSIGDETFVVYSGPGGNTFTLPLANAQGGKAKLLHVLNIGSGASGDLTLKTSGGDSVTASVVQAGQATSVVSDGATKWMPQAPLLVNTIGRILLTLSTLDVLSVSIKQLALISGKFTASANRNLSIDDFVKLSYEIDAQGHALTSSEFRGLHIHCVETDLGGASHVPFSISDLLNPTMLSVIAGTTLLLQTKLNGLQIDTVGGFTIGTAAGQLTGFHGAKCAQAAHPTTLGDVITILTNKGLCA